MNNAIKVKKSDTDSIAVAQRKQKVQYSEYCSGDIHDEKGQYLSSEIYNEDGRPMTRTEAVELLQDMLHKGEVEYPVIVGDII